MAQQRTPLTLESDKPLTTNQEQLVDLVLSSGKSVAKCAEELGRDVANCYRDLRKPHVKKYLQERTLDHIGILAPIAARAQEQLLRSDSDHVRANVAENILDRHLGKPVVRQAVAFRGALDVKIDLS